MDCNTAFFMSVHLGAITGENAFIAVGLVEDTHPLVRAPGWANDEGDSIGYHSDDGAVILSHRPVMNPGGKSGESVRVACQGQASAFTPGNRICIGYDGDNIFFVGPDGTRFTASFLCKPAAGGKGPGTLDSFWTRGKTFFPVVYVMGETVDITVKCETKTM